MQQVHQVLVDEPPVYDSQTLHVCHICHPNDPLSTTPGLTGSPDWQYTSCLGVVPGDFRLKHLLHQRPVVSQAQARPALCRHGPTAVCGACARWCRSSGKPWKELPLGGKQVFYGENVEGKTTDLLKLDESNSDVLHATWLRALGPTKS